MEKLHLTRQRQAILDIVRGSHNHPTASDVMDVLRDKGLKFAYGTVYNSLRYLTEHGMIRELNLGEGTTRYDGRMEDHHHAVCEQCGQVMEVTTRIPEDFLKAMELETGFVIRDFHMHLHGLCTNCQSA